jgi:hypothetical protein
MKGAKATAQAALGYTVAQYIVAVHKRSCATAQQDLRLILRDGALADEPIRNLDGIGRRSSLISVPRGPGIPFLQSAAFRFRPQSATAKQNPKIFAADGHPHAC